MPTNSFETVNFIDSKDSKNFDKLFNEDKPKYKFTPSNPTSPEEIKKIQKKAKELLKKREEENNANK